MQTRIYKDKQYLIFDYEDGRTVKYDFATKQAIGIKGKPVKDLRSQLSGLTMEELIDCCDDEKYAKFLRFVRNSETYSYLITNIGTIFNRVPQYSRFEQLFSAGIDEILDAGNKFKYKINDVPKALIKLCKNRQVKLSNNILEYYKKNPDAHLIAYKLEYMSLTDDDIYNILATDAYDYDRDTGYHYWSYFNKLLDEFGYTAKPLLLYIDQLKTFEALEDIWTIMRELYDYANMMKAISPKFDKYPRHFLTTHKIACRNYNRMKKEFPEELFKKRINKQYECSFGDYIFIYPDSTQDIKDEAVSQNNCVASYIDRVINGECHILFLRKKNKPDDSLVTIEVRNNKIVQARRRFNDPVTDEDQKVIDAFNKKFANSDN